MLNLTVTLTQSQTSSVNRPLGFVTYVETGLGRGPGWTTKYYVKPPHCNLRGGLKWDLFFGIVSVSVQAQGPIPAYVLPEQAISQCFR